MIVILLHNIRSLQNVGSIFRTADAAGVKKIYLCGFTPAPVDVFGKPRQQVVKASLGAENFIEWDASARSARATIKLLERLKKERFKIFAVEQDKKAKPYYRVKCHASGVKKVAVVLGNEIKGLPPSILKRADKILEIPMNGRKESLNVSVAAGIVLYRLRYG